jgi:hypothetical protein
MAIDGTWQTVTKSPLGDQPATITLTSAGDALTGSFAGAAGSTDIKDGKVDGDTATFAVDVVVPMPMTLTVNVTADGDALSGTVTAGAFGSFPITGTRG